MARRTHLIGYGAALAAGVLWGTTGPLSTAVYAEGLELADVGFWRIAVASAGLVSIFLLRGSLDGVDGRGWLVVGLGGGVLVAVFEFAYQHAIAGVGVAGAAALLYTAPVIVAGLAHVVLGERLGAMRLGLALVVMVGAGLTVWGGSGPTDHPSASVARGLVGGSLAAFAYASTTLLARWAVPRYGTLRVLTLEILGGTLVLWLALRLRGVPPVPPQSASSWIYVASLGLGAVVLANVAFFQAVRRIDAAPASVAATIEPVVATLLALLLFGQGLEPMGWLGLALAVGGVAMGYAREAAEDVVSADASGASSSPTRS
jgi:DME family drug/metabolite transporter